MKDYRLRIGMRFIEQGREYIIEGALPGDNLRIRDTVTESSAGRSVAGLLEALFAGRLELIGDGPPLPARTDGNPVADLTLLEEGDVLRVEMLRRLAYVEAVSKAGIVGRTRALLAPIIGQVSTRIGDSRAPSWSTLKRWCLIHERSGEDARSLVPAIRARGNRQAKYSGRGVGRFGPAEQQKAREVAQIIDEAIRAKYLSLERPSVASVHETAVARIVALNQFRDEADKLPLPHLSSIYPVVRRLDPWEVALGRHGRRHANEKFRVQGQRPRPVRPLERVECDDTKLDLLVIDPETRLPLGRPWLTTMIDVGTRMITGFHLGFHPPGYLNVMRCLLQAVRPKSYLSTEYPQIEHDWPVYGVPEMLIVDNARQFHSTNFELACRQIGTRIEYAPPRTPWYKASIERWFGTQNRRLLHELPGTTFSHVLERDEYDPQQHAVIALDAMLELVHLWIVDIYHQTVHRGLRDIPHRRWLEAVREWPPHLPARASDLEVLLGFTAKRAISPSGIELFTLRYNSAELAALRRNPEPGGKVIVRYDPQDLSVIYVHDPVRDRMIAVPALDQDYTRKLTIWQHHVIRRYARRTVQGSVDIEALCRAREKIRLIVERERFLTGRLKGRQRIAQYLDLGQQPATRIDEREDGTNNVAAIEAQATPVSDSTDSGGRHETAAMIPSEPEHAVSSGDVAASHPPASQSPPPEESSIRRTKPRRALPAATIPSLPQDRQGWSADYSLPIGNGTTDNGEVTE